MGIRHPSLPVFGIQFHPESVGSPMGNQILLNFINKKPVNISRIYIQNQIKEP
jgi:GMP synthase-like glutamine amidotransferase